MIDLQIDSLAFGGDGVGRHQGQAVFVPFTVPGDLVRCKVVQKKRRYLRAEVVELLEPGAGRCQARCPVFGRCGGCQWQHLDYPSQLAIKENLLADILRRQLKREHIPLAPVLGAASPWNYRSRVQFKCHLTGQRPAIGFFRRGSHFVEAIDSCPIAADGINQVLSWLYRQFNQFSTPGQVFRFDVSVGDQGRPRLVVHGKSGLTKLPERLLAAAEKEDMALFLQTGEGRVAQHLRGAIDVDLRVAEPPLWLGCGPGGFSQVNLEQNRTLVDRVLALAGLEGHERVLDLYCGMGNLTLPLARCCDAIVGVEDYAPSIEQARHNADRNGIGNVRFFAADAARFMSEVNDKYDLVVLDPPRAGAALLVEPLLKLRPTRILYVSCDPMTLARDLGPLLGHDYRLVMSQAIDLFPQTYHLESITLLERSQS